MEKVYLKFCRIKNSCQNVPQHLTERIKKAIENSHKHKLLIKKECIRICSFLMGSNCFFIIWG